MDKSTHSCRPPYTQSKPYYEAHGTAIEDCTENERGEFWVGNGEYGSRVNFCPFCGAKAPAQIDENAT